MVELNLAKVDVVGSNPIGRSKSTRSSSEEFDLYFFYQLNKLTIVGGGKVGVRLEESTPFIGQFFLGKNGIHRAFRLTCAAINALVRVDEHR